MIRAVCIGLCLSLAAAVAFHFWRVAGLKDELVVAVAAREDLERQYAKVVIDAFQRSIAAANEASTKREAEHGSIRDAGTVVQDNIASVPQQDGLDAPLPAALADNLLCLYRSACAIGANSGSGDAASGSVYVQASAKSAGNAPDTSLHSTVVGQAAGMGR